MIIIILVYFQINFKSNTLKNTKQIKNISCESYNCKINKMFNKKSSFFKLLYELRIEERDINLTYEKRNQDYLVLNFEEE